MNGIATNGGIEKKSGLTIVELHADFVTTNVAKEEMNMGMLASHNVFCGDFVVGKLKFVMKEKKVEHTKKNMKQACC